MVHLWHGLQGDGQKHKPHDTKYDYRLIPKYIITPGVGLDFEFHQDPSHNATLMVQRTKKFTRIRMDQGEFRASNRTNPQKKTLIESTNTPNDYLSHVGDRGSYSKSKVLQNGGFSDVATQKTETCHITYSTITHQRVSLKHQTHAKNICVYQFIIRFITWLNENLVLMESTFFTNTLTDPFQRCFAIYGAPWIPSTKKTTQC